MALRVGQILRGARGSYELLHALKGSTVFEAKLLPDSALKAQKAMIKTAITDQDKYMLKWENLNHGVSALKDCPTIRKLEDTIPSEENSSRPSSLVFEWMDCDLEMLGEDEFRYRPILTKRISKAVLEALVAIKSVNGMHTDIKPGNIFISNLNDDPIVKLGDLGTVYIDRCTTQYLQCMACRAPEVWQGLGCRHVSDVWSLGVTLTTILSRSARFGPGRASSLNRPRHPHCLANMMRLVGPIPHPPASSEYKKDYELAEKRLTARAKDGSMLIDRQDWRTELANNEYPPVSEHLLDFIGSLLTVDHEKRPTAEEALQHPYFEKASDEEVPGRTRVVRIIDGMRFEIILKGDKEAEST